MRRPGRDAGYTMVELAVALLISFVVVMALGRIVITSQKSWEWGRDKVVLQQNTAEALAWMTRSIRTARSVAVVDTSQFRTYDADGALAHTFRRVSSGGQWRLQQDGADMVARACSRFRVTPNGDTTSLTLTLALQDSARDVVTDMTRVTLRGRTFEF
ncbi:MAG: hypothetical protein HZB25_05975 [Candidatus Eisenbacteria bacterium]|nr:hypothetical protein [Candidatus Eisenbacteria bacterium]